MFGIVSIFNLLLIIAPIFIMLYFGFKFLDVSRERNRILERIYMKLDANDK